MTVLRFNWLAARILSSCRASCRCKLADLLTFAGVEIEGIEQRGGNFDNVVVAQINSFAQHPNADRLSVCDVNDGTNPHRQIVCGAKNFKAGDKVPAALPGAALPNGLKIKVSKLRGVESQGMLCSPSELLISAGQRRTAHPFARRAGRRAARDDLQGGHHSRRRDHAESWRPAEPSRSRARDRGADQQIAQAVARTEG